MDTYYTTEEPNLESNRDLIEHKKEEEKFESYLQMLDLWNFRYWDYPIELVKTRCNPTYRHWEQFLSETKKTTLNIEDFFWRLPVDESFNLLSSDKAMDDKKLAYINLRNGTMYTF